MRYFDAGVITAVTAATFFLCCAQPACPAAHETVILCVGDSMTAGSYPAALERRLNASSPPAHIRVVDTGIPGAGTDTIVESCLKNIDMYRPDIVIVMMGANDWGRYLAYGGSGAEEKEIIMDQSGGINESLEHLDSGFDLRNNGRPLRAMEQFRTALSLDPANYQAAKELAWLCRLDKDYAGAQAVLESALAANPNNDRLMGALAQVYSEMGESGASRRMRQKAREFRSAYYNPVTKDNYRRLLDTLAKRHIEAVCMQYPMREKSSLVRLLKGAGDICTIVDNESSFKKAVKARSYYAIFVDMEAGDFGHLSRDGCALLADNLYRTMVNVPALRRHLKQNDVFQED